MKKEEEIIFNSVEELVKYFDCDTFEEFERNMYKYTACGMPVHNNGNSITLTGYVESDYDYCGESVELIFPFTLKKFNDKVAYLEERSDYEWKWLNEDLHDLGLTDEDIEKIGDEDAQMEYRFMMICGGKHGTF